MGFLSGVIPSVNRVLEQLKTGTTAEQDLQNMPTTTAPATPATPAATTAPATPAPPPATVSPDYGTGLPQPYIPGYSAPRPGIEAAPIYTYWSTTPSTEQPAATSPAAAQTNPSLGPFGSEQAVTDVFNKYFGRAPAKEGLEYWTKQVGPTLEPQERDWILNAAAASDRAYMQRNYPTYWSTPNRQPARAPSESAGGPMDIGTFTPSNVVSTTPRLNTNIAYNVGPSLSQMYADQLARETGARGLREDEIQSLVRSGFESIGRPVGSELGPSAGELAFQERQLRTGAVSPTDFGRALQESTLETGKQYAPGTYTLSDEEKARMQSDIAGMSPAEAYNYASANKLSAELLAQLMPAPEVDTSNKIPVTDFTTGKDTWFPGQGYDASKIPADFDWRTYLGSPTGADLLARGLDTEEEARRHYASYGINENRVYTQPVSPTEDAYQYNLDQINAWLGSQGKALEGGYAQSQMPEWLRASMDYYNERGAFGDAGLPTYGPSPSRASFIRGMQQDELGETVLTDTLTGRNVLPSGTVSQDGTTTASGATMFTTVPMSANDLYSSFFDNPNSVFGGRSNALSPYVTRTTNPQYSDENAWDMQQRGITPYNYSMSKDQYDQAVQAGVINPNEYKYDEAGKQILRVVKFAQGGAVNSDPMMDFIRRQDPAAQRAGVTPKQVQKAQDFLSFAQSKRFGL